ncbi:probable 60S ribosomal protein L14 [Hevea brasiliensis]|uniref:probable 60S ribosomal protein L14 n=1 Tax=Hevea brasiliensis TaxID=3981 RepID=UPI0025F64EFD|nr:probable 60S ribosomal protein L14 [Hevea brasiliensis]
MGIDRSDNNRVSHRRDRWNKGLIENHIRQVQIPPDLKMSFKRYVEVRKVALINYEKDYGKLGVIIDVIDQSRAIIGAPEMVRSQMNFKRRSSISRLKLVVPLPKIGPWFRPVIGEQINRKKVKVAIRLKISAEKEKHREEHTGNKPKKKRAKCENDRAL